jgi:transcriptional regulator with XRE-family HTH domain
MFWDRFEYLCKKIGKKPNPVASEIGFSSTMITKYKKGSVPNGEILSRIADYFGVSTDYLLGRDETLPIIATESEWEKILLHLSDESRNQLEEYIDYLLWKQNRADSISQSSCEPE